LKSLAKR